MVSKISILFLIIITSPFIVMFVWCIKDGIMNPSDWIIQPPEVGLALTNQILIAMNLVIWNCSGLRRNVYFCYSKSKIIRL